MVRRVAWSTGPVVALVALAGCISRTHAPYLGPPDPGTGGVSYASVEPRRIDPGPARSEAIRIEPVRVERRGRGAAGAHRRLSIVMPPAGGGRERDPVRATYHQGPAAGRKRLVVVLPIWGASTYPPRQVVRRLLAGDAAAGTDVLEIHGERKLFDWASVGAAASEAEALARLAEAAAGLSRAAADVRRLLDWARRRGDVDAERVGLVGLSVGAMVGSLVMGGDDRLAAGVFVMGGARLHEVLGACRGRAGDARRRLLRRFGWDAATFRREIEAAVAPHDPARLAGRVHPSRVLLIDAAFDHCMPEAARDGLWEALGRPERITLRYGHKIAFFSMTPLGFHYTTRRIVDFLDRRLRPRPPRPRGPGAATLGGAAPSGGSRPVL